MPCHYLGVDIVVIKDKERERELISSADLVSNEYIVYQLDRQSESY